VSKSVFISYRRQDTASAAGRLYDRLCSLLPKGSVFFDVSTIAGGEDFVTKLTTAIQKSNVVLVFIGKQWAAESADQSVIRVWDAADYVRVEVSLALEHSPVVLPVLVDGAQVPLPEQLPENIRPFEIEMLYHYVTKALMTMLTRLSAPSSAFRQEHICGKTKPVCSTRSDMPPPE
jgi:hypothetical protein